MQKVFLLAFLLAGHLVYAQETTISGTVTEAYNNAPIIGATIMVKDAGIGTITDLDGRYELPVLNRTPPASMQLLI